MSVNPKLSFSLLSKFDKISTNNSSTFYTSSVHTIDRIASLSLISSLIDIVKNGILRSINSRKRHFQNLTGKVKQGKQILPYYFNQYNSIIEGHGIRLIYQLTM